MTLWACYWWLLHVLGLTLIRFSLANQKLHRYLLYFLINDFYMRLIDSQHVTLDSRFSISQLLTINLDTVIDHRVAKTCQHFPSKDEEGNCCLLKWPLMNSKMPNWKVLFACQFVSGDNCHLSFRNSLIFSLLYAVRAYKLDRALISICLGGLQIDCVFWQGKYSSWFIVAKKNTILHHRKSS